jgi:hypothetical protein
MLNIKQTNEFEVSYIIKGLIAVCKYQRKDDLKAFILELAEQLRKVVEDTPQLNKNGLNNFNHSKDSQKLLTPSGLLEFAIALSYLEQADRTKQPNTNIPTSYGLKHQAEKWGRVTINDSCSYVSNGALIAAASSLGFKLKAFGTLNCNINISKRWIKNIDNLCLRQMGKRPIRPPKGELPKPVLVTNEDFMKATATLAKLT